MLVLVFESDFDVSTGIMVRKSTNNLGEDISPELHTAQVLKKIADSIHEMICFTTDVPTNHSDVFLPVLDVKVSLTECGKIVYQFFEKPTKHNKVILADSALSWQQKRTILTQEALRRLRNTSLELGTEVQNKHLADLMLKMKDSGYSEKFRNEIVSSAQAAFKKIVENHENGTRPIHRNREQMLIDKGAKNSSGYSWWNKGKTNYNSVLYVPPTPNGILLRMLKKHEEELNFNSDLRSKILKKGGTKFRNLIVKSNPFKPEKCHFKVCPLCKETRFIDLNVKNVAKCKIANVGYRFICQECNSTYEGETARV